MSGPSQDGILLAVFFVAFVAVTAAEIYWLAQKRAVPIKKALTTVFLSNFLTITLGFFVSFIIFGLVLATSSDGNAEMSAGRGGTWGAFIAALGFPFLLMAATRRLLIGGLRIEQIDRPLIYAVVSTSIFFAAVFLPSAILLALR